MTNQRIVKIIRIVDTRAFIEDGDRFVPVPGSGDLSACARCNHIHEIHVTVELTDGKFAVVGLGCANQMFIEQGAKFKVSATAATRLAKLEAQNVKLRIESPKAEAAIETVMLMKPPAVVVSPGPTRTVDCGDFRCLYPEWMVGMGDEALLERIELAKKGWRVYRLKELGYNFSSVIDIKSKIEDNELQIQKIRARMTALEAT